MNLAVSMQGVSKRFGTLTALDNVSLEVESGTIHALVGENGAGKTTLMRILYGAGAPDEGTIQVEGKAVTFGRSADAIAAGVGMVSQHYAIIPELTCLQNLIVGAEPSGFIDYRKIIERANSLAARMGFEFDWHAEASTLSPSGAQKLEILKLLWREARIMILDEPTAMLSPADSDMLFESIQRLVRDGSTVILVTHRLPEVLDHCKRVTVLRGGKLVANKMVSDTNAAELAEMIVGEPVAAAGELAPVNLGETLVDVRRLVVVNTRGNEALKQVSLTVRAGEVVGIAGVDGSGQRELIQALLGVVKAKSGDVELAGCTAKESTAGRLRAGLRLVPEDRHDEGVIEDWSLVENAALGLQRLKPFANGQLVDVSARQSAAERIAARFRTKHNGLKLPMSSLSGGNQQRFVAGRALECSPRVIVAFQPARGLDLKGTADVYSGIREAVRQGAAAIVVSFDLDELVENCDRVVAMCNGMLTEPPAGLERDRATIGRLMVGAA